MKHHTPSTIRAPFARYSHGVEVPRRTPADDLFRQLSITLDDAIPPSAEAQTELCFENVAAILASAGNAAR